MSTREHGVSTEQGNARGAKEKAEHQQPQQERGRNRGLPESGQSERGLENVIQNPVIAPTCLGLHTGTQEPAGALHGRRCYSQASPAPHQQKLIKPHFSPIANNHSRAHESQQVG